MSKKQSIEIESSAFQPGMCATTHSCRDTDSKEKDEIRRITEAWNEREQSTWCRGQSGISRMTLYNKLHKYHHIAASIMYRDSYAMTPA